MKGKSFILSLFSSLLIINIYSEMQYQGNIEIKRKKEVRCLKEVNVQTGGEEKEENINKDSVSRETIYEIVKQESKDKIDENLVKAIIEVESEYNPRALSADGKDYGLMQIRDVNHEEVNKALGYELDYFDSRDNIRAGIYILKKGYDKYYENSGIECVLMAYNMGEQNARDLWGKGIYSSKYSRKVMQEYNKLINEGGAYNEYDC